MRTPAALPTALVATLVASALVVTASAASAQRPERSLVDPSRAGGVPSTYADALGPLYEPVAIATEGFLSTPADLGETSWDVPGQIVVDARDDLDAPDLLSLATDFGLSFTPTRLEPTTKIQIATVPMGDMASVLGRLSRDPRVEFAEPLARVRASFVPNDPLAGEQWHMERIGAPRAWDFSVGRGVTVAVVDTGIACEDHGPFMKGTDLAATECVAGWNFVTGDEHANDDQGHGTHVAGTIAQSTNNGIGASGVAFGARLMPVKVLNESGWGTTADVADGIRWAADHGAHVINLSLGGPRNSKVLQKAIDHATSMGAVVVAAAGNTGGSVQFPGASDGVIGVSATDPGDKLASFSSRGEGVDLAAPGVKVVQQTVCNKGRNKCEQFPGWNGTSMASPHVAGAAALVMGLGVTDPAAVEDALRKSARVVDSSDGGKRLYGAGVLDAAEAAVAVTKQHAFTRLVALVLMTAFVARAARKKNKDAKSPLRLDFLLPALAAGPGLFFFAPWLLPRADFWVDVAARPIADLDLLVGVSLHRFLPLANAFVPFALTAVGFGMKRLRPAIAGISVGTGAYLLSLVALGDAGGPFGRVALVAWCVLNAAICAWIARTNLAETR
ncbi:S8 family peptidase [Polyangium sp. 6x1]|uniref:S8 family peptidase n=1 Tax=Polyangium sp. 6x1 TaxID=3042689 RepID=UPI00248221EA|nr:S8 family peptidase [Polyangium sp. 6x1]MDI1443209.1 S8 family peptidase [Polyangium sp. 6x1]